MPEYWRKKLHSIIFESDTVAGKTFDVVLIITIILSVVVVMLISVSSIRARYGEELRTAEWIFTVLFTIEYLLRVASSYQRLRYVTGFYGLVDLLAIAPTYLSVLIPNAQYFLVIRLLRMLRIFRVLKLSRYLQEAGTLTTALKASRRKIEIFVLTVLTLVVILGSIMHVVEGEEHGFESIPLSIYWAIVTLTTVGYGDISPQTALGQTIAAFIMILGYGIIAVPTGIVTSELTRADRGRSEERYPRPNRVCPHCSRPGHDGDAAYCKYCGGTLNG